MAADTATPAVIGRISCVERLASGQAPNNGASDQVSWLVELAVIERCINNGNNRPLPYTWRHEASRDRYAAGTAAPTGDPVAQRGQKPVGSGTHGERVGDSVFRWAGVYRANGLRGLQPRPTPGRPPKLSRAQRVRLERALLKGPLATGYATDLWTLTRVAEVIQHLFGVRYHPCHVWRLLHSMDWSCQKPERRALQRDEAAITRWKQQRWPHIKNAARCGAHLVFVDESGFLLAPNVTRTWAPRGRTPVVYHLYKHDRLSAISALAVSPRQRRLALYLQLRPRALDGLDVGIFLVYLLRHIRGRIVLLWDQGSIHRRREVTLFLRQHPRVRVEEFPSYAPELNPAEFLWTQGDRSLANSAPADLADLRQMLRRSTARSGGHNACFGPASLRPISRGDAKRQDGHRAEGPLYTKSARIDSWRPLSLLS
jgi:transposase